jgi:hypothetical protein
VKQIQIRNSKPKLAYSITNSQQKFPPNNVSKFELDFNVTITTKVKQIQITNAKSKLVHSNSITNSQ